MVEVLGSIQQQLIAQVPALKYVDENWGQLDYYSQHPPVQWPCCLIDIGAVAWKNLGNKQQEGTATITLYVANLKLTNTSGRAPAAQRNNAWAVHGILQSVQQALHHYLPATAITNLYRKTTARMNRDDGIQQYVIIYECKVPGNYDVGKGMGANNILEVDIER